MGAKGDRSTSKGIVTKSAKAALAASLLGMLAACAGPKANELSDVVGNDAIIGGQEISAGAPISKSIVAVYDAVGGQLCTGSLLPDNIVLTAAHCIGSEPKGMFILFDVSLSESSEKRQAILAVTSPLWTSRHGQDKDTGDIALIKFAGTVPATYAPASILPNMKYLKNGGAVTLAGFGISNGVNQEGAGVLRQVDVKIADTLFSKTEIKLDQTSGKGACHGDSGGPAYVTIAGHNFLWGITSRGVEDAKNDCSQFSAYTNVLAYKSWIDKTSTRLTRLASLKLPASTVANVQ